MAEWYPPIKGGKRGGEHGGRIALGEHNLWPQVDDRRVNPLQ
jgi:hypothetical protein